MTIFHSVWDWNYLFYGSSCIVSFMEWMTTSVRVREYWLPFQGGWTGTSGWSVPSLLFLLLPSSWSCTSNSNRQDIPCSSVFQDITWIFFPFDFNYVWVCHQLLMWVKNLIYMDWTLVNFYSHFNYMRLNFGELLLAWYLFPIIAFFKDTILIQEFTKRSTPKQTVIWECSWNESSLLNRGCKLMLHSAFWFLYWLAQKL